MCGKQTLPLLILGKSRMRKRARTDLCGGRSAMVVPTATVGSPTARLGPSFGIQRLAPVGGARVQVAFGLLHFQ